MENSKTLIKYNDMVAKINALSEEELDKLLAEDRCPFQPELVPKEASMGMFHCRVCGNMVLAGVPHPRRV
jgi:hypothetical protein